MQRRMMRYCSNSPFRGFTKLRGSCPRIPLMVGWECSQLQALNMSPTHFTGYLHAADVGSIPSQYWESSTEAWIRKKTISPNFGWTRPAMSLASRKSTTSCLLCWRLSHRWWVFICSFVCGVTSGGCQLILRDSQFQLATHKSPTSQLSSWQHILSQWVLARS